MTTVVSHSRRRRAGWEMALWVTLLRLLSEKRPAGGLTTQDVCDAVDRTRPARLDTMDPSSHSKSYFYKILKSPVWQSKSRMRRR